MITNPPKEEAIFRIAAEISDLEVRSEYLQQMCGDDQVLLNRLLLLLRADEESTSFLEAQPPGIAPTSWPPTITEKPDMLVGPYKLREQIGEGGFGVVFVAEQTEPVARKVALKVVKPGMDTRQVIARFEAERQALALMDHPNVACVLDAGETQTGRPYFAMELIHGVPITEFCDSQKLPTRDRLRIFVDVCLAVQHAHQKGIIHRDIKPSNVMVTMRDHRPIAKVIDFGVAKALGRSLTEKSIYTAYGQMVGTPMYMSPEQAQMSELDVDTRSDVYSLGVLAYELLTGSPPFDKESLEQAGIDEMRRIIVEQQPRRPSVLVSTLKAEQLTTVSDQRRVEASRFSHSLKGELDWIVMKSLEKDRTRRYETAASLADDVNRFLDGEAVNACPPTTAYLVSKFMRRHRAIIGTASIMLMLLIGGIAGTSWQAMQATDQKDRAVAAEALAEERLEESENSRLAAIAAQEKAESARAAAEAAQKEAENARQEAELARSEAEAASIALLKQLRDIAAAGRLYQANQNPGDQNWEAQIPLDEIELARKAVAKALEDDPSMIEWIVAFGWTEDIRDHIIETVKKDAPMIDRHYFQLAVDLGEPELYPYLHETVLTYPWPERLIDLLRGLPDYDLNRTIAERWKAGQSLNAGGMAIAAARAGEASALTYLVGMLNVAPEEWRDHVQRVIAFRGSEQEIVDWHRSNYDKLVFDESTGRFCLPGSEVVADAVDDADAKRRDQALTRWAKGEQALGWEALGAATAAAEFGDSTALDYLVKKLKVSVVHRMGVNEDGRSYTLYTNKHRHAVLRVVAFRGSNKEIIDWYNANRDRVEFDPFMRKFILPEAE